MGPALYILAIMGCGEGETQCRQVAIAPASYHSQADCQAATEAALTEHLDAAFPVVVAECRRAGTPASASLWADEVKLPEPEARGPRIQHATYQPKRR